MTRFERWCLGLAAGACLVMVLGWVCDIGPGRRWELKLNHTESLARGLYLCERRDPGTAVAVDTLVAFELLPWSRADIQRLAPYVHITQVLKQAAAVQGDTVCLQDDEIRLNGVVIDHRPLLATYSLKAV